MAPGQVIISLQTARDRIWLERRALFLGQMNFWEEAVSDFPA